MATLWPKHLCLFMSTGEIFNIWLSLTISSVRLFCSFIYYLKIYYLKIFQYLFTYMNNFRQLRGSIISLETRWKWQKIEKNVQSVDQLNYKYPNKYWLIFVIFTSFKDNNKLSNILSQLFWKLYCIQICIKKIWEIF